MIHVENDIGIALTRKEKIRIKYILKGAFFGVYFSSKNLLEEHINTHTGVRPYVCQICSKNFASKYTYKAHVKTHEVRPRPFECTQCNKTFLSQQNLNQHERTHNGIKEYVCHQCGKIFVPRCGINFHICV